MYVSTYKYTQAYHAKIMSKDDSELELQTPLFQPYSFSADKVENSLVAGIYTYLLLLLCRLKQTNG